MYTGSQFKVSSSEAAGTGKQLVTLYPQTRQWLPADAQFPLSIDGVQDSLPKGLVPSTVKLGLLIAVHQANPHIHAKRHISQMILGSVKWTALSQSPGWGHVALLPPTPVAGRKRASNLRKHGRGLRKARPQ